MLVIDLVLVDVSELGLDKASVLVLDDVSVLVPVSYTHLTLPTKRIV